MKKLLFILVVIAVGCATEKRCMKKFPPRPDIVIELKDTVIYRDTIIEVEIPGDTAYVETYVPWLEEVTPEIAPISAYVPLAHSRAWVEKDKLKMSLIQHDSILEFKIDSAVRDNIDTVHITQTLVEKEYVKQKSYWMHGFFTLVGIIIIGAVVLYFILRR